MPRPRPELAPVIRIFLVVDRSMRLIMDQLISLIPDTHLALIPEP
jgi:hypothetical protein